MKPSSDTAIPHGSWLRSRRKAVIAVGALTIMAALYVGMSDFVVRSSLQPVSLCPNRIPSDSGLVAEEIRFRSAVDRIPLVGWLIPASEKRAIVLVHGLNSSSWTGTQEDIARAYVEAGLHVLVFDGRGRGRSGGDRLGLGWHERRDVRGAVNLLLGRGFEPGRIGVHGTSYGAAIALLSAAAIPEIGAVVADSGFADMRDLMEAEIEHKTGVPRPLAKLLSPGIALVARLRYGLDFDVIPPERAVPQIAPRPILFIHGEVDQRIPVGHSRRLLAASQNTENKLWHHPLGHTDGVRTGKSPKCLGEPSPIRDDYLRRVTTFFDQSLK